MLQLIQAAKIKPMQKYKDAEQTRMIAHQFNMLNLPKKPLTEAQIAPTVQHQAESLRATIWASNATYIYTMLLLTSRVLFVLLY